MDSLSRLFGKNVHYYRKRLKLTQLQLAELADVTTSYIGLIENGKTSVSFGIIENLSAALQVNASALFSEENDENQSDTKTADGVIKENEPSYSPVLAKMYYEIKQTLTRYEGNVHPKKK